MRQYPAAREVRRETYPFRANTTSYSLRKDRATSMKARSFGASAAR
jgi:hypothetical protein